jgi:hypothetical protein
LVRGLLGMAAAVALLAGAAEAAPRRRALLLGASGEEKAENFFVQDLRGFRKALVARGWEVEAVVGARPGILPGSRPTTARELRRALDQALGAAKKGDQLLILVHDHGLAREAYWGQRAHSIVTEDRERKGYEPGFDLDVMIPALAAASARGARVAVADFSCYSGATQRLAAAAACVLTLAAEPYISLCSGREEERLFGARFFRLPPPGRAASLEEQFLAARREDKDSINIPVISSRSTPALAGFTAFLKEVDPLDTYEDLKELRAGAKPFDPKPLLAELDALQPDKTLRARVAEALDRAVKSRKRLEDAMPALAKDYDGASLVVDLPGRDPLPLSPGNLTELLEPIRKPGADPYQAEGFSHAQRTLMAALQKEQGRLARKFAAELGAFGTRREAFDVESDELARAAGDLFNVERELYDEKSRAVAEGCRAFAL